MKRVFTFALALLFVCSTLVFAFGCDKKDAQTDETSNEQQNQTADAGNEQQEDEEPAVTPDGADFRYEATESGVTITAYTGTEKRIAIPSTIDGKAVVGIQSFGITNDDYDINVVEYLEIPNSVTNISNRAFAQNKTLVKIKIGNGVTTIPYRAFYACNKLKTVTLGPNVRTISNEAFMSCGVLESVNFPNGLTTIGSAAFEFCDLKSISLPNSIRVIEEFAFTCNVNLHTVTLAEGIQVYNSTNTSCLNGPFGGDISLEILIIPASVTTIADSFFNTSRGNTASNLKTIRFLGNAPSVIRTDASIVDKSIILYYPANATGWDTTRLADLYTLTPYTAD